MSTLEARQPIRMGLEGSPRQEQRRRNHFSHLQGRARRIWQQRRVLQIIIDPHPLLADLQDDPMDEALPPHPPRTSGCLLCPGCQLLPLMPLDLVQEQSVLRMHEGRSGYQFFKVRLLCQTLHQLLNPNHLPSEHRRDPLRCYRERCQLHLRAGLHRTLTVSPIVLVFRMLQMQAITLLVLRQARYNLECSYHHPRRGYRHRSREMCIVRLETMKRRKCHLYQQFQKHMSRRKTRQQSHHSSSESPVCLSMLAVSIALPPIVCQGEVRFEIRQRTIENRRSGNMVLLQRQMTSIIMLHLSKKRTCNLYVSLH